MRRGHQPKILLAVVVATALLAASPASADEPDVVIGGAGWGHGVGLSQYGAWGQALDGKNATQIATYYYSGAKVRNLQNLGVDPHLYANDTALWVALPGLQSRSVVTFSGVGGPIDLCQSGDGEGDCPKQSAQPQAGESWSFETLPTGGCQFYLGGVATGTPGGCRASLSWDEAAGARVEVDGREYKRGEVKIRPVPGSARFHVSLAINLEDYMYGLAEVPGGWHMEALKVQALAGRSYAAFRYLQYEDPVLRTASDAGLSDGRKSQCWCHIYATTIDQYYAGYSHETGSNWGRWRDAVDGTRRRVISHATPINTENSVIQAFYSSSTGGATENSEDRWVAEVPFLRSKPDPWSLHERNPNAGWDRTVSAASFASALGFATVDSAAIVETYQSGSPKRIRVTGMRNGESSHRDYTGPEFRSTFDLKSHYVVSIEGTGDPPPPPPPDDFTCRGLVATIIGTPGDDVLLGTPGPDIIVGLEGNDVIKGRDGDDIVCGGPGDDVMVGGEGDDVLTGGVGVDRVSYSTAATGVIVNLAAGTASGGAGTDTLVGVEAVTGSRLDDVLIGNRFPNTLSGLAGADLIEGRGDDDVLAGGSGPDRLDGGDGDDELDGGGGVDLASYAAASVGVTVKLVNGHASGGGGADVLVRIEDVMGTRFDDVLIGDEAGNELWGLAGDDKLRGRAGDDVLRGGAGDDRVNGEDGFDVCRGESTASCEA